MRFFFEGFPYRLVPACRGARRQARPATALRAFLATCVALSAASCGSDPPETLTCAWLADTNNCWNTTAAMAMACLPPESEQGMLSADNSTCMYPSGSVVTFTPPVVIPLPDNPNWNFTISDANGQECVHYQDLGQGGAKLVVMGNQTVSIGSSGGFGLSLTCPDGKTVQTSNAFNLLDCPGSGFFGIPGLASSSSLDATDPPFLSAGLNGTGVSLFDCSRPAP